MPELWDLYDLNRNKLEGFAVRGEKLPKNTYHLGVRVCVFNEDGQLLIQQRAHEKDTYPDYWDITAVGSAIRGEDSQQGAHRELFEEMGIDHDFTGVAPSFTTVGKNAFGDTYIFRKNIALSELHLQKEEVQNARYATLEEILAMIQDGSFLPYRPGFIEFCFASMNGPGVFTHRTS